MDEKYTGAKTETRQTEVSKVLSKLSHSVEQLHEEVDCMEARLTGVTVGSGIEKVGANTPINPEFGTEMAQKINSLVREIEEMNNRLSSLRNRIEL